MPADMSGAFTVVTHNVCMGLCVRLERALQRSPLLRPVRRLVTPLAQVFARHPWLCRTDILGLQEICLGQPEQLRYFEALCHACGFTPERCAAPEHAAAATRRRKGQALLSRFPIRDSGSFALPRVGARRAALWADLEIPCMGGPRRDLLRLYNVHLSNRAGWNLWPLAGRARQIRAVLDHAAALESAHPGAPVIVLGDFNTLGTLLGIPLREPAIRVAERALSPALTGFRRTMLLPYMADWIFYRHLQLEAATVVPVLRSDHFPVAARFRLGAGRGVTDGAPPMV